MAVNKLDSDLVGKMLFTYWVMHLAKDYKIHFPTDPMSPYDASIDCDGHPSLFEIKYRDDYTSTSSLIQSQGVLLEELKFNELMNLYKTGKYKNVFYYMFFSDCVGYLFNLNELYANGMLTFTGREMPSTTKFDNVNKKTKSVAMLQLNWAWHGPYKVPEQQFKRIAMPINNTGDVEVGVLVR